MPFVTARAASSTAAILLPHKGISALRHAHPRKIMVHPGLATGLRRAPGGTSMSVTVSATVTPKANRVPALTTARCQEPSERLARTSVINYDLSAGEA